MEDIYPLAWNLSGASAQLVGFPAVLAESPYHELLLRHPLKPPKHSHLERLQQNACAGLIYLRTRQSVLHFTEA